jgi:3-deoxy-D-manno-octulosonate 8-phosphate phosphatase (KDO 8-P phosphatase)
LAARRQRKPGAREPARLSGKPGSPDAARASRRGISARLSRIRLLALDVDGVLTDGRIVRGPSGKDDEYPAFDVQDGLALKWLRKADVAVAWISGRGSPAVASRARELGVRELHLSVASKRGVLRAIQERLGVEIDETAAMGDDLPDLGLRAAAGFFAAPSNARREIAARADLVTVSSGGRGAVRELCEEILRAKGIWPSILDDAGR